MYYRQLTGSNMKPLILSLGRQLGICTSNFFSSPLKGRSNNMQLAGCSASLAPICICHLRNAQIAHFTSSPATSSADTVARRKLTSRYVQKRKSCFNWAPVEANIATNIAATTTRAVNVNVNISSSKICINLPN